MSENDSIRFCSRLDSLLHHLDNLPLRPKRSRSANSRRHHGHGDRQLRSESLAATTVTLVNDQTKLTRNAQTNDAGAYDFVNLPIGTYTLTFTHDGFQTLNIPSITVQANRTVTVNATLKVGEVGQTVTVEETPLINSVDTTNGYVMDKARSMRFLCRPALSPAWPFFRPA